MDLPAPAGKTFAFRFFSTSFSCDGRLLPGILALNSNVPWVLAPCHFINLLEAVMDPDPGRSCRLNLTYFTPLLALGCRGVPMV